VIEKLFLMGLAAIIVACAPASGQSTVKRSSPKPGASVDAPSSRANPSRAPASPARRVVPPRRRAAQTGRPWLGVYLRSDGRPGVLVRKVHPGSPAAKAGLQAGDRILTINNATLASVRILQREVASYSPGDKVALEVRRSVKSLTIVVQLERLLTYAERVRKALVGKPAPPFTVARVGAGSKTITSGSMKGKVWLLEFWATWCGACRQVIPMLKKIHQHYAPYGLHIVSIAKDKPARVARLAALLKLPYTVGVDPRGKVLSKYLVNPIPAFMLINQKGIVIDVAVGRTWAASFRRMLKTAHAILTKNHNARHPAVPPQP
jgi:thiol-disulfide isomerase/thioredoxin